MTLRVCSGPPGTLATALIVLLLSASPAARAEGVGQEPISQSPADSSASVQDEPTQREGAGGDVRRVRASGAAAAAALPPGVRRVGSGWDGHRVSLARGVVPATLTEVTLRGRSATDWVDGGLDLLAVSSPDTGVALTPNGPDLSVWPVYTAEWPGVVLGGVAPLTIDQRPLRRPGTVPFSRLTAVSGPFGQSLLAVEFGRHYRDGSAITGFFETEDGRAPLPRGKLRLRPNRRFGTPAHPGRMGRRTWRNEDRAEPLATRSGRRGFVALKRVRSHRPLRSRFLRGCVP